MNQERNLETRMINLPVPADRVVYPWVSRETMPSVPYIQAAQVIPQQDISALHMELINILQSKALNNPIRIFLFNMFASNGFNNQGYTQLFEGIAEYFMALKTARRFTSITNTVNEALCAEITRAVNQHPPLVHMLSPEMVSELNQYANIASNVRNIIQTAAAPQQQQGMYPQQQMGMYPQQQMGMYPQQQMGARNQQMLNMHSQGSMGLSLTQQPFMSDGGGSTSAPSTMARPKSAIATPPPAAAEPTPHTRWSGTNTAFTSILDSKGLATDADMRKVGSATKVGMGQGMGVTNAVSEPSIEFIYPFPPVVTEKEMLVNTELHGKIKWGVTEMNYDDHEKDIDMFRVAKEIGAAPDHKVMPRWNTASMEPILLDKLDKAKLPSENEVSLLIDSVPAAQTPQGSWIAALLELSTRTEYNLSRTVIEVDAMLHTPVGIDFNEVTNGVKKIDRSNLTTFIKTFKELGASGAISVASWHIMHKYLTELFNRRLKGGLGVTWTVDSIVDDYEDSIELLHQEMNLSVSAMDTWRNSVLMHLVGSVDTYMNEDADWGLSTTISILHLPWLSRDLNMKIQLPVSMLSKFIDHSMKDAIISYAKRTNTNERFSERKLIRTLDNVWLEVWVSDYGADTIYVAPLV